MRYFKAGVANLIYVALTVFFVELFVPKLNFGFWVWVFIVTGLAVLLWGNFCFAIFRFDLPIYLAGLTLNLVFILLWALHRGWFLFANTQEIIVISLISFLVAEITATLSYLLVRIIRKHYFLNQVPFSK